VTPLSDLKEIGKLNLTGMPAPKLQTTKNFVINGKRAFDKVEIT
jgi:hypothetical protein